ncbi:MAG: thioredoxin family protein [Saprospiraceae bacterium]
MKKVLRITALLMICCLNYGISQEAAVKKVAKKVKWYTWEEAVEANKTEKKKFIIDIYTDWCGWCKVMDKKTFSKKQVATYINENFYPVKLNAEQRESIMFQNKELKYHSTGRRGVHELAYSLLNGKMSYPSIVYLNADFERILISPGFKKPKEMIKELSFVVEEKYKEMTWQDYQNGK